jgi:hypothetical protein
MKSFKKSTLISVGLALLIGVVTCDKEGGIILSDSMDDCVLLESLFDCTDCGDSLAHGSYYPYDVTPEDAYDQDYELVTCNFPGQCPDGTVKNTCTWQRYLYIDCTSTHGGVTID